MLLVVALDALGVPPVRGLGQRPVIAAPVGLDVLVLGVSGVVVLREHCEPVLGLDFDGLRLDIRHVPHALDLDRLFVLFDVVRVHGRAGALVRLVPHLPAIPADALVALALALALDEVLLVAVRLGLAVAFALEVPAFSCSSFSLRIALALPLFASWGPRSLTFSSGFP